MESLSAFLPTDRRRALSAGNRIPDRVRGAVLFVDISGFTPLTAALRHELGARRGAEELIRHLNGVFSDLINSFHRFYGNVIGFSGDAITCWFDDRDTDLAGGTLNASTRAAACALELQSLMTSWKSITTSAGKTSLLGVKVAVASGPARRFLVGDPQTYVIEVLAGATLDRMSAAEKFAQRGQIILSSEVVAEIVPAPIVGEWLESGDRRYAVIDGLKQSVTPPPPMTIPVIDDETARPWLLPPVYEHLRQGAEEFLAELRPAVPMFVKFSGIDYDEDDDAGAKLDIFVRAAQTILDRYEGYLLQITMGDKGSYLYISFGAPVAHENDTDRAAAAALDLRELPARLEFLNPLQIGISQGLAHSGAYGSNNRRTFAVMGNEVNLSARMMTAAGPGQILVSRRVAELIGANFILTPLPPLALKGIEEPFSVSELIARKKTPHGSHLPQASNSMFGREAERAQIHAALARLSDGQSSVLLIEGAAGIGKSLLIQDLHQKAEALSQPLIVLAGFGDPIERSTTYFAWRPILETLLNDPAAGENGPPGAVLREALLRWISPEMRPLAPLMNSILPLNLPENVLTEQMTGDVRQENTQRLIIELLRSAVGGAPLVLIFDDAHWLDSASWALIGRAQRELSPLLLVITTRLVGDEPPVVYAELRAIAGTRHIFLDTLPQAIVEELVCRQLGITRLPPEVARLIHDKAEGHPFFSEELAYALRDAGLLIIEGGEARLAAGADLDALDFPNTIQGVITSRIDRLPAQQQLTVKVASVIGRIFAFRILSNIYPIEIEEKLLREYLDRLERLDITPRDEPEPNLAYFFKHLVTQEVIYSLMTSAQRQQLHRNTALWYEGNLDVNPRRILPLLAHHWQMAGDPDKAADYYEKAGENAFHDYANQEAIRFLEQAEALSAARAPAVQRARRHRLLGEANYRLTRIDQSIAEYQTALALLGRAVPRSAGGRGLGVGRQLVRQVNHRLFPKRMVGTAPLDERSAHLEASRVLEGTAEIYYNLGDFLASFYCTMTAFNLAERVGPSPELMRGYANMCATMGTVSLNSAADSYRRRMLELEPEIDDLQARAWSRIPLSTHSLWVGNWERAERETGEALNIYAQLGDWRRWSVAAWIWPQVAQCRGELERARELWAELYSTALRSRDTRHQVRGRGGQFFNFLSLDESAAAQECLEGMRALLRENPEMTPVEERLWHAANAAWFLQAGEWAQAIAEANETLAAIGRARFKFDLLEVFSTPAEVLLSLWKRGEATANDAETACKALNSFSRTYAFARPRALRARGRAFLLEGNIKKARKLCEKSLAQAQAMGMRHELALSEALLAECR